MAVDLAQWARVIIWIIPDANGLNSQTAMIDLDQHVPLTDLATANGMSGLTPRDRLAG